MIVGSVTLRVTLQIESSIIHSESQVRRYVKSKP